MWLGRSSEVFAVHVAIGRGRRKARGNPEDEDERDGNDIVRWEFVLHGHKLEIACEGCLRSPGSGMSVVMIPFPAKMTRTNRPAWLAGSMIMYYPSDSSAVQVIRVHANS
jgi:hypothetical protein